MSSKAINTLLLLLLFGAVTYIFIRQPTKEVEIKETVTYRDSIVRDTIRDTVFFVEKQTVVRNDTLVVNDTIYKLLPISRYEFNDSTYRFVVEGYNVKPILLETYPTTRYIMKEKIVNTVTKPKRITSGISIGAGMFYGTKGLDVGLYVGYGVNVRL